MQTSTLIERYAAQLEEFGFEPSERGVEQFRESRSGYFTNQTYRPTRHFEEAYRVMGRQFALDNEREATSYLERDSNIVVNEGLAYILGVALTSTTDITTWYVTCQVGASHTPVAGDTYANWHSTASSNEVSTTEVTETIRRTWTPGSVTGTTTASIDNSAAVATYTGDTGGPYTFYGAALLGGGTSAFGHTASGTLYASSLFGSSKSLDNLDTLDITYTFTATDS